MDKFHDFKSFTILTTDKCTAKCAHCCVSSSPKRKHKLSYEQIRSGIDRILDHSDIKVVVFAGGEPSLLKRDLVKSIKYCTDIGLSTRVVTNASWAINSKRSVSILSSWRDAGLKDLNISADDFHLPFIPIENVKTSWDASKGLGFNCVIISLATKINGIVDVSFLRDLLGSDVPTVYDENGASRAGAGLRDQYGTLYAICNRSASMSGRGRMDLRREDVEVPDGDFGNAKCPWIKSSPALAPTNELVSCCGFEVRKITDLNYGGMDNISLESVLAQSADDVLINAIAKIGPQRLARIVRDGLGEKSKLYERYVSMCEACEDVMANPENINYLRSISPKLAAIMHAEGNSS